MPPAYVYIQADRSMSMNIGCTGAQSELLERPKARSSHLQVLEECGVNAIVDAAHYAWQCEFQVRSTDLSTKDLFTSEFAAGHMADSRSIPCGHVKCTNFTLCIDNLSLLNGAWAVSCRGYCPLQRRTKLLTGF